MPSLPDEFFAAPSGTRLDSSRLGNHARWLVIAVGSALELFWIVRLETIALALAYMLWRDRFTTCVAAAIRIGEILFAPAMNLGLA
jgi:hypothetical protein